MNIKALHVLVVTLLTPLWSFGQTAVSGTRTGEVLAPIHRLFDGMRAGDSTMVRSAFHPIARLVTTFYKDEKPAHHVSTIDDFTRAVGTPHEDVFDERIWDVAVDVRDNLASVWMKYAFFLGDDFSHCGVNSFELFVTDEGWKVMHLADTRQKENCEMPPGAG